MKKLYVGIGAFVLFVYAMFFRVLLLDIAIVATATLFIIQEHRRAKWQWFWEDRRREGEEQSAAAGKINAYGKIRGVTWLLRATAGNDAPVHWHLLGALHHDYRFSQYVHQHKIPFTPRVRQIIDTILRELETKHRYEDVVRHHLRYMGWECGPVFIDRANRLRFRAWPLFLKTAWQRAPAEHEHCFMCWLGYVFSLHRSEAQAHASDGAPDRLHEHVETNFDLFPLTLAQAAMVGVDINEPVGEAVSDVYWGTAEDLQEIRQIEMRVWDIPPTADMFSLGKRVGEIYVPETRH